MKKKIFNLFAIFKVLFIKEIYYFIRYPANIIHTIFFTLLYPFSFYLIGKTLAGPDNRFINSFQNYTGTRDFIAFAVISNIMWMMINIILWDGGLTIQQDRVNGTFEAHYLAPINYFYIVLGRILSILFIQIIPVIFSLFFYSSIGFINLSKNSFLLIIPYLISLPFLIGTLLIFSSLTIKQKNISFIIDFIRTFISIFCGIQVPITIFPEKFHKFLKILPMTRFMEMVRGIILFNKSLMFYLNDILYILLSGLIILVVSFYLYSMTERKAKIIGNFGGY